MQIRTRDRRINADCDVGLPIDGPGDPGENATHQRVADLPRSRKRGGAAFKRKAPRPLHA